jgi:septal ring factor EnvC (AmiA/AmiB activator)
VLSLLTNKYALAAIGLALLLATGYGLYQRGNAAVARAESAEAVAAQFKQDLAESEADKALLREMQKRLDSAVRERDARLKALQKTLGELDAEYEKLEKSVGKEDQDCLRRGLPDAFAERLRQ